MNVAPLGLVGVGAAVPSGRLDVAEVGAAWDRSAGRATLAVCGPDEDCLTLAWRAATSALDAASVDPGDVDGLWWGCARPPMAEGPSFAFLATSLGLRDDIVGLLASGSTHAGADALDAAHHAVVSWGNGERTALVVASDALVPGLGTAAERATGAGAAALVLRLNAGAPAVVAKRSAVLRPLLDRYRGLDQPGTGDPYDPRLYRERELIPLVVAAIERLGRVDASTRWSLPDPDGRLGAAAAKAVGKTVAKAAGTNGAAGGKAELSEGLHGRIGDAGSASVFLGAVRGWSQRGSAGLVAEGGGRASAWVFDVRDPVPGAAEAVREVDGTGRATRPVGYAAVLRARGQLAPMSDPIPMGVPPGSAAFVRGNAELLGIHGRRCPSCATIAVPPSIHPVCPSCGTPGGETVAVARAGTVHTFVVNHTMPPPFEAPLPMCVVDLDDGARVMLQGLPEDSGELAVGDRVTLELRRYAVERGVPVYGYKVRRADPEQVGASRRKAKAPGETPVAPVRA